MQAQDTVTIGRVRRAGGAGYWSAVVLLVAVILGAFAVTAGKAYRNHAGYVGVANDDPGRAVVWTLGERIWQGLSRARRVVTPKPVAKEQAGMAYYLFYVESEFDPGQYQWVMDTTVFEQGATTGYETDWGDGITGPWLVGGQAAPAPTVTASGAGYLVSGAGTTAYNGQYNPNGATCNGEAVYELGYGPSPKWSWPTDGDLHINGGWAFGEQSPEIPESASTWADWSNGAGGPATVGGDGDWGKLQLGTGQVAHSPVKDFQNLGWSAGNCNLIGLVRYGDTPVGGMDVYWRESDEVFLQDDALPAWTQVTVTPETSPQLMPMTKRYRQIRLVGQ